jgi:translation initiation factor 1 (eIF-1/SUI1)
MMEWKREREREKARGGTRERERVKVRAIARERGRKVVRIKTFEDHQIQT